MRGGRDDAPESTAWLELLTEGSTAVRLSDRLFAWVPGAPKCKLCHNPLGGIGGRVFSKIGCVPSKTNPAFCTRCVEKLPAGGATIDIAVLFADIRGSTSLGEQAGPDEYADLLNRFYRTSTRVLVRHDAIIDKIVGDEVMALFVQGFSGPEYRRVAAEAGVDLVATLNRELELPVGAAVNAGIAYVGSVGSEHVVDFTAIGDTVNTAARLQGHARAGELVLAASLYPAVASDWPQADRRSLEIRGRREHVDVRVLTVA